MFGNLALSIAAAAAIVIMINNIESKHQQLNSQVQQTKKAIQYEKAEGVLNTDSYAKLNVKPHVLFVTDRDEDKVLLAKLSRAVNKVVKQNSDVKDISCDMLANTGEITLNECNKIKDKQFTVLIPSNPIANNIAVTISNNTSDDEESDTNRETKQIVKAVALNAIMPNPTYQKKMLEATSNMPVVKINTTYNRKTAITKVIRAIRKKISIERKLIADNSINRISDKTDYVNKIETMPMVVASRFLSQTTPMTEKTANANMNNNSFIDNFRAIGTNRIGNTENNFENNNNEFQMPILFGNR